LYLIGMTTWQNGFMLKPCSKPVPGYSWMCREKYSMRAAWNVA